MIMLVLYTDDIVIIRSDFKIILSLKSFSHSQFHTKDLVGSPHSYPQLLVGLPFFGQGLAQDGLVIL